jgi:hypothetical protein
MTCRDIDNLMSTALKNPARDPQVIEHLGKCGGCRALVSVLGEGGEETAPLESNLRGIEVRIVKSLKPVRPLAPSQFFLFACAIIFLCVVAIGATPFGMNGWGALSLAQRAGIFAALTTSALLLAVNAHANQTEQRSQNSRKSIASRRSCARTLSRCCGRA